MKKISILLLSTFIFSCVSKKKYIALEQENGEIKSELTKTKVANEDLETKFAEIQQRVDNYNSKITSLQEDAQSMLRVGEDGVVASSNAKAEMRNTLTKVDAIKLNNAKTLKDSMNLAVAHNLGKAIGSSSLNDDEDIAIDINETVVMISISDKMLFNSGSYRISSKANDILQKLADVINSESSLDVMVEGHTDARSISTEKISDN